MELLAYVNLPKLNMNVLIQTSIGLCADNSSTLLSVTNVCYHQLLIDNCSLPKLSIPSILKSRNWNLSSYQICLVLSTLISFSFARIKFCMLITYQGHLKRLNCYNLGEVVLFFLGLPTCGIIHTVIIVQ